MCIVATEDELSEGVAMRLLFDMGVNRNIVTPLGRKGFGYLKANLSKFCNAAYNGRCVLLITDLDSSECAPSLISDWLGTKTKPQRLVFRVAVREVETWLMADRENLATFLGISKMKIPMQVESILRPKEHLLELAKTAKREIRNDLLPRRGAIATQGFGYNSRLMQFVNGQWSPASACEMSPSLKRACLELDDWARKFNLSTKVV